MDEYDLKESAKFLGELYPVLLDAKGHVIADGFNRKRANPDWHTVKLKKVDSPEKLLAAKIIANCARREVPRSESEKWVNDLASHLENDGHIASNIAKMTGMSEEWVRERLSDQYKPKREAALAREAVKRFEKLGMHTEKSSKSLEPPTYREVPEVTMRSDTGEWIMNDWDNVWEHIPDIKAVTDLSQKQKTFLRAFLPKVVERLNAWIIALGKEPTEGRGGEIKD